jgi:ADP-ribose pyrophosphatase YjhB (NUDIX family)
MDNTSEQAWPDGAKDDCVMKERMTAPVYPGYPTERLIVTDLDSLDNMTLPDGEWTASVSVFPTLDQQQQLHEDGYELDNFGRPLHPWLREMLTNPEVGVVTGLGQFWNWGPNRAADPIVINNDKEPKVLLIKRGDTGAWALPGGFIDPNENGIEAARRELFEEAGLAIDGEPIEIYNGVVADARATAHAWPETVAVLWRIEGTPDVSGNDDAIDAQWFPVNDLPAGAHGSHSILIEKAVARLNETRLAHVPKLPSEIIAYEKAKGGNMSYTRVIATMQDGSQQFIKSHDERLFTDPIEESDSRLYLRKEKQLYDHMAEYEFAHLPESVNLDGDHTLSMRALTDYDGWHWRAPRDSIDAYVADIFTALDRLEQIPLPDTVLDNKGPINHMLYQLGWMQYDFFNSVQRLQILFDSWSPQFYNHFRDVALELPDATYRLYQGVAPVDDATVLAHHDMRQSNIAWHPDHGARLVDWSWAGAGPKNADATMLLIDLHKSGHDVSKHMDRFNTEYARTMIGFWLHHCQMASRTPNSNVRFHQALSAVSAYDLLMKYGQR